MKITYFPVFPWNIKYMIWIHYTIFLMITPAFILLCNHFLMHTSDSGTLPLSPVLSNPTASHHFNLIYQKTVLCQTQAFSRNMFLFGYHYIILWKYVENCLNVIIIYLFKIRLGGMSCIKGDWEKNVKGRIHNNALNSPSCSSFRSPMYKLITRTTRESDRTTAGTFAIQCRRVNYNCFHLINR